MLQNLKNALHVVLTCCITKIMYVFPMFTIKGHKYVAHYDGFSLFYEHKI